jgi:uncharacterized CHY-type Zn-finger protein
MEIIMNTEFTSLGLARLKCKATSKRYLTFWYVRKLENEKYAIWAHDSHDDKTVACFYCGEDWSKV